MNKCIILAAGAGTRMKSNQPKVLHEILNKPMLHYVIEASKGFNPGKTILITGHGTEAVEKKFEAYPNIAFALQPIGEGEPYGTGYAAMQALPYVEDEDKVLILSGDTPLITEKTLKDLENYYIEGGYSGVILSATTDDLVGYGRIIRDISGEFTAIREDRDCNPKEKKITEINGGIYLFSGKCLREGLASIDDDNAQGEYYLTDVVEVLSNKGYRVGAYNMGVTQELDGINSRAQLAQANNAMKMRINEHLMNEGVTIIDPENTWIGPNVEVGKDSIIWPGAVLEGDTKIGEATIIRGTTRIVDSSIGNGVTVESSLIENSVVGNDVTIGPFAHLRPNAVLEDNVKIGNFVEVKNATMKSGSKASHLSYVGDASVGERVNIGCGVIFVNYDGKNKFKSVIEDDAFVGSNSNVVAPVHVGKGAFIAAGSTVTCDVNEDTLVIARAKEVVKEGWSKRSALKEKSKEDNRE
ncbi:MAG: bifunctional UDP-N-acetylglucosamine diphosphorylase/glucosamine-1-phosphate N-acetyltransferase GlmU [Tissierellia bacterium]|nr:bifunctional UDP-N-acetylglucosamine diphosphorylase/glucosamine-1-phosphate N-acetyltransferase GlmU [Tissierellia bacterium]